MEMCWDPALSTFERNSRLLDLAVEAVAVAAGTSTGLQQNKVLWSWPSAAALPTAIPSSGSMNMPMCPAKITTTTYSSHFISAAAAPGGMLGKLGRALGWGRRAS
jgi:hypothetical protein